MKKISTAILLMLFGLISGLQAQQITGTVTGADDGLTLPGVSIVEKGTTNGTSTDFDGNFSLELTGQDNPVLVFSFMGMQTQEVVVGNQTNINVVMATDAQILEDVVVVGYGTQLATKVSGAISAVDSKTVERLKPVRAEDALQGQAAGVNVINTGSPGAKPTVLVRGIPSYTGTDPLVVIDGNQQTLDDLNALNSSDIESINVLKDAALSAIYGVKGGNGVIVVKTKSGKKGQKTSYNFDTSYGIQEVTRIIPVLNATEYAAILNEASVNAGQGLIFNDISKFGEGTNWQDEVLVNAPIVNANFSATGGGEKSTFFISAGYLGQDGVVAGGEKSNFNRANFTANFSTELSDKWKFISNTSYANIQNRTLPENSVNSVLANALNFDPTVSPYVNGKFGISETITQEIVNPLAQIDNTYNDNNTNKLFGKLELQYTPIEKLTITSRLGYTYVDLYGKTFDPLRWYGTGHNQTNANEDLSPIVTVDPDTGEESSTSNRVSESHQNWMTWNFEMFANYDFTVGENNNFSAIVGTQVTKSTSEHMFLYAEGVPFNSWEYADISAATGNTASQAHANWQSVKRNLSYFGRINYDYDSKYLFTATVRADGSTSFGENNKFAFFPSGSAAWVVSQEDFFDFDFVNNLKLRASYGSIGNDNITPQFPLIENFANYTFNDVMVIGSKLTSLGNPNVTWETQIQTNFGFDLKFADNRFSLTADYFTKDVNDLLFAPTLSLYLGEITYPVDNIGSTRSSGFELTLGYIDTWGEDFNVNTNVNFTTVDNKVTSIDNGDKFIWGSGYGIPYKLITRFEEGYSPGYFFGHKTDGIFQNQAEIDEAATQPGAQPGDIRYVDINEDGVIDDNDRTQIGDPFPEFTLGWNLSLSYKGFDLSSFVYASIGSDIYRAYERNLNYTNKPASVLGRWTGEGTSNDEPRVTFVDSNDNIRPSDRFIEDGSFVRLKNIQLGYTLPANTVDAMGLKSVRVYGQVRNAATWTTYSGYDPEISGGVLGTGIDRGTYPQPRIWSLGLNVKF